VRTKVDVSDPERQLHIETTDAMLADLGAGEVPRLYVFNKADRAQSIPVEPYLRAIARGDPLVVLSARDPVAVEKLKQLLLARMGGEQRKVFVPYAASEVMSAIYRGVAWCGAKLRKKASTSPSKRSRTCSIRSRGTNMTSFEGAFLETQRLNLNAPRGRPLIRGLSLSLGRERVAMIGRNGVGKSTLLSMLAEGEQHGLIRRKAPLLVPQELAEPKDASPGEQPIEMLSSTSRPTASICSACAP
jgi:tRNA U34 5-carboxymethylaminomethyl modifying GTPase MnmE/TrmE